MEAYQVALLTVAAVVVVELLLLVALGGGSLARLGQAVSAFRAVLGDPIAAAKVHTALNPPPPEPPQAPKLSGEPVRLLALLQRESRLLDFLLEEFGSDVSDEQLGAGVRDIHKKAQQVIKDHLTLEPVLSQREGDSVQVPPGFDPSAIQLVGNVAGNPPFFGTLQHHGWRVKSYKIPAPPEGQDELVVAPAQVELPGAPVL